MTSEQVRGCAEVGANLGVVFGILFLVYAVRQTAIGQRAEAETGISERFTELDGGVAENAERGLSRFGASWRSRGGTT